MSGDTSGYVYCIKCCECPVSRVKIGLSQNPDDRLRQFQTGSPCRLEIAWAYETEDMIQAEKDLHSALKLWHLRDEWFSLPENVIVSLHANLLFCQGDIKKAVQCATSLDHDIRFSQLKFPSERQATLEEAADRHQ